MTREQIANLIADDNLGLLKVNPKRTPQTTEEERLLEGFQEIIRFVEENEAAPTELGTGMNERVLFARLESLRRNPTQCEKLRKFDDYGLLDCTATEPPKEPPPPATMDDILKDDFWAGLGTKTPDIFILKHVPQPSVIESPDYVARRKPCKDFDAFKARFQECQRGITAGQRRLLGFMNEQEIDADKFYILHGVLLLVAEVGERTLKNGKRNARLRCIFENGTESDMLLRSLATELYKDGRFVAPADDHSLNGMLVTAEDKAAGFVYVLRSLSQNPEVKAIPNLHKIGLTLQSVEKRIENAENDPTFLMAPVAIVTTFQFFNLNLSKMENLLHKFFDGATVKVQIKDAKGDYSTPKEWFSVPRETISTAVKLLISGEIVNYHYSTSTGEISPNKQA